MTKTILVTRRVASVQPQHTRRGAFLGDFQVLSGGVVTHDVRF